mmetsp:Transcript_27649/g.74409  ORF Transcript_27649/g.74409 Transcript_27649/m.74409 type:complete len:218 (-) Transcript_27649:48-701(-)
MFNDRLRSSASHRRGPSQCVAVWPFSSRTWTSINSPANASPNWRLQAALASGAASTGDPNHRICPRAVPVERDQYHAATALTFTIITRQQAENEAKITHEHPASRACARAALAWHTLALAHAYASVLSVLEVTGPPSPDHTPGRVTSPPRYPRGRATTQAPRTAGSFPHQVQPVARVRVLSPPLSSAPRPLRGRCRQRLRHSGHAGYAREVVLRTVR